MYVIRPGVVAQDFNPSTQEQREALSSRTAGATQRNSVSKKTKRYVITSVSLYSWKTSVGPALCPVPFQNSLLCHRILPEAYTCGGEGDYTYHEAHGAVTGQLADKRSLLPLCGWQEWNLGWQAWWQALAKPSRWPTEHFRVFIFGGYLLLSYCRFGTFVIVSRNTLL